MSSTLRNLKALGDATRLRLVALLAQQELSVNELQEITGLGQSRISTHLGVLQETGLLVSRKDGKRSLYRTNPKLTSDKRGCIDLASQGAREQPEHRADLQNLKRVLQERNDQAKVYFNQIAGRFDQKYGPGRSWQAFGQMLINLLPPLEIADLGSGEGLLGELLARRAKKVTCVDNSKKIVEFGQKKATKNGLKNLSFKLGDIETPPLKDASVDVALFSQALHHAQYPDRALKEAFRILRPNGKLVILDLLEHQFEQAREVYGDHWLGFPKNQLHEWSLDAGFTNIEIQEAAREEEPPHFTTLLLTAAK